MHNYVYLPNLSTHGGSSHLDYCRSSYKGLHMACSATHIPLVDCSNHRTELEEVEMTEKGL